jgi:hypothetical protein
MIAAVKRRIQERMRSGLEGEFIYGEFLMEGNVCPKMLFAYSMPKQNPQDLAIKVALGPFSEGLSRCELRKITAP